MPDIVVCANCEKETYGSMAYCPHCGDPLKPATIDWNQRIDEAKTSSDWAKVPVDMVEDEAASIVLTSSFYVSNREIEREIEFITAECVYGMNFFRDFFAAVSDVFGGRSGATEQVLRDARRTCLAELRREALMVGADAVIAVDLDYQELSGGQKSGMLMLVASGTAVKLKAIAE